MNKMAVLEACLFTTEQPLPLEQLCKITKIKENEIKWLLKEVEDKYKTDDHGIFLSETGGYRLAVKPEYIERVADLTSHADLSRGLLRVLSIIAYYEPIKQSDIVKVIGNRTYEYIGELVDRGLIKTEKISRTKIITTTSVFEEYFGAKKTLIKKIMSETKTEAGTGARKESEKDEKTAEQPRTVLSDK